MSLEIGTFEDYNKLVEALSGAGAFLITGGADKANIMTIGWATLGVIWGKPIMTVLVRPSRHSYDLINSHGEFCVCVPDPSMTRELALCGTKSGRDHDKFAECNFSKTPGNKISVPSIAECIMHYECRIVHKNNVNAGSLTNDITHRYYRSGDFHSIYYGEVLGVYKK